MSAAETRLLDASAAQGLAAMTFPAYRHLLALLPAPRHGDGEERGRVIQPIAVGAWLNQAPAGLLVAELPLDDFVHPPVLLSVYVVPEHRNLGVATALVARLETEVAARGFGLVETVYMTGKPGIAALERVLSKRQWLPPITRTITVRFTPEEAATTPWFDRVRLPGGQYEIFAWGELVPEERDEIRRSHERSPWIAPGLEPWRYDYYGFDSISSLGLRYQGKVVGWVINHRISADCVRFTCSFVRRDLSRRGRILPLYTESIRRLARAECTTCTLVTPLEYGEMAEFLRRRCASAVQFFGETRGVVKKLS